MKLRWSGRKSGFSLVEVCLAVLVVGLGLLSVFSLFPTGLAASEAATNDTAIGLLSEQALFGLQAKATEVTWDEWKANTFNIPGIAIGAITKNDKNNVAYRLDLENGTVPSHKKATLTAMAWKGTALPPAALLTAAGTVYYSEIYYTELP